MTPAARNIILGSRPFSPLRPPGLVLWLDAADRATLWQDSALTTAAAADTNPVGGWKDKSSRAKHVIQTTAGSRPLLKLAIQNGLPVIRADGVDDVLSNASFGGVSFDSLSIYFAGAGYAPAANTRAWMRLRDTAAGNIFDANQVVTTNVLHVRYTTSAGANALSTVAAVTAPFVACFTVNAANNYLFRVNGAELSGTFPGTKVTRAVDMVNVLSDTDTFTASDFYECAVYNAAHARGDALQMESYLRAKWGA